MSVADFCGAASSKCEAEKTAARAAVAFLRAQTEPLGAQAERLGAQTGPAAEEESGARHALYEAALAAAAAASTGAPPPLPLQLPPLPSSHQQLSPGPLSPPRRGLHAGTPSLSPPQPPQPPRAAPSEADAERLGRLLHEFLAAYSRPGAPLRVVDAFAPAARRGAPTLAEGAFNFAAVAKVLRQRQRRLHERCCLSSLIDGWPRDGHVSSSEELARLLQAEEAEDQSEWEEVWAAHELKPRKSRRKKKAKSK